MVHQTKHRYIVRNDQILGGEPIIDGTRTPVRSIVQHWRMGESPEEILIHLPYLTMAQIFDALSYYSDHMEEIHQHIQDNTYDESKIDPDVRNI